MTHGADSQLPTPDFQLDASRGAGIPRVRIRMYRVGLGDCFLVTLAGPPLVHILVDCGTLRAATTGATMRHVVDDIRQTTGGRLHLLVVTHAHWDHVSGFWSEREAFDAIRVDRVWVGWTENPQDPEAIRLTQSRDDLLESIVLAVNLLSEAEPVRAEERAALRAIADRTRQLLEFAGETPGGTEAPGQDAGARVRDAMAVASLRAGRTPSYVRAGQVVEPEWAPGVRIYVLGPPSDVAAIVSPGAARTAALHRVSAVSQALSVAARFCGSALTFPEYRDRLDPASRQTFERSLPFDDRFRLETADETARRAYLASYDAEGAGWRRIDADWLTAADDLALQLDNAVNNTSVVLALELIDDRRVLLLPGDAQLASWQSWTDLRFTVRQPDGAPPTVTASELLRRTVFYKVSHHGTNQGTRIEEGLDLMPHDDLMAALSVDARVAAERNPPWNMPAGDLHRRLLERTRGRVLRSDTGWPAASERPPSISAADWTRAQSAGDVEVTDLYVEMRIR
jgi:hypothetical protein